MIVFSATQQKFLHSPQFVWLIWYYHSWGPILMMCIRMAYCCSIAPRGHKRCLCRLTLCSGLWYVMWRSLEQLNFFGTRINGNSIRNFGCLRNGLEWETESAPTRRHRATIHINTSSRRVHDFRHVDWADDTHTNTHTQCIDCLALRAYSARLF